MATTGGILYGLSIVLVLLWPTLVGLDLSGLLGGVGIGLLTIASLTAVLQWFPERRGLVAGLALAGATLGSSIPGLFVPLLYGLGSALNATFVLGLCACLIAIIAAQLLRQIPEGDGPFSFQTRREYKAGEVLLSPVWYILLVLLFCSAGIGLNMAFVTRWLMGSYAFGIYSITSVAASMGGRILGGWLSDLIGRPRMLVILFGLQVVAWLAFLVRGAIPDMLLIGLILLCIGGCASVVPATTADVFGAKNVGAIYGIMLLIAPLGSIPMALLLSSSGVYAAIPVLAGILLVGVLLAFVLSPLTRKGV
jgi:OFA family oxalate/formate antiporter-like MFS transporter